jgi:hypothetical protein
MFPYERVLAEMKKDGILQFLPLADVKGQFLERSTFLASYIGQILPVGPVMEGFWNRIRSSLFLAIFTT